MNGNESTLLDELDVYTRRTYEYYDTVDKLLGILRQAAAKKPYKMVVTYDPVLGYPLQAELDPIRSARDDELYFRLTAFKAVSEAENKLASKSDELSPR